MHPIDVYEAGMAISSDHQLRTPIEEKRMSPIPSHILPGYVPGMPRPMTPRDDAENAVKQLDGKELRGQPVRVTLAEDVS